MKNLAKLTALTLTAALALTACAARRPVEPPPPPEAQLVREVVAEELVASVV